MIHSTCLDHIGSSSEVNHYCIPLSLVRHTVHTMCHCYTTYITNSVSNLYIHVKMLTFCVNSYRFTYSFCGGLIKYINKLAIINSAKRSKRQCSASVFVVCLFSCYIQINLYLNFRQLLSLNIIHPHTASRLRTRGSRVGSWAIISVCVPMWNKSPELSSQG